MLKTDSELFELVSEVLDVPFEKLHVGTQLNTLENWDSLNSLRLISKIERGYGIRIELARFHKLQTMKELSELIQTYAYSHARGNHGSNQ